MRRPSSSILLVVTAVTALAAGSCGRSTPPAAADPQGSSGAEAPLSPTIVELADAETRVAPPGSASVRLLARGHNAFVARLEMDAGAAVPEHQDADEEYIVVVEGGGTITIDGVATDIGPGTTIFMPAGATVSYRNGPEPMVALQVFAGPGSAAKYDRWAAR